MTRVAIITNIPTPYRVPVFNRLAQNREIDSTVFYCARSESNRLWDYDAIDHKCIFLEEKVVQRGENYIHNNADIIGHLARIDPDVIITSGFNPTHLYAFGFAMLKGKEHIPTSDGTLKSEAVLNWKHRLVRRFVYSRSRAFIGASDGSRDLYRSYGVDVTAFYKSHLAINNEAYLHHTSDAKKYDLIFSGQFIERKGPLFALKVVRRLSAILKRDVSIQLLGSGPMEARMREEMKNYPVSAYKFQGFVSQRELPAYYGSARVFVFPTAHDAWGVVANEACAAGLPVIATPAPGVAGELVRDGVNGFLCELDEKLWCERLAVLLTDMDLYNKFSANSVEMVREYSFENAARGIADAVRHAMTRKKGIKEDIRNVICGIR